MIFKKYSDEILIKDIHNFKYQNGNLTKVLNHFFEEIIFESCGRGSKISPMDVLKDDKKIEEIFKYIETKPNFYTGNDINNLKSFFRNAVGWVRKVANFPPKTAREIQNRYNIDNRQINVLDTSAGFGSRMSAALLSYNNYCGIDPNVKLYKRLNYYYDFLTKNNLIQTKGKIYCCGSEVFLKQLVDKFDVSFTSPPYFNLEYYCNDEYASTKCCNDYNSWVDNFVIPTINNTYQYLKIDGYAMINIKNLNKKITLFDDFFSSFQNIEGFDFVETFDMKINKKQYGMADGITEIENSEPVMVFRKVK